MDHLTGHIDNRIKIPEWMETATSSNISSGIRSKYCRSNFLVKSLRNLKMAVSDELLTERYARQDGYLQKLDPRVKLIAALTLIILAGLTRNILVLLALWGLSLVFMALSHLPVLRIQKRIWGFIPLITLLAAIPGMLNIINDGTPLLMIYQSTSPETWLSISLPASIFVSKQGATAALFLFLRVGISLSFGVLLTISTPVAALLKSLRILGMPALFVMIIEMTYRYLSLLLNISIEMFEARSMRTVGNLSARKQRAQVGSSIASLFARSMALSDEVYHAMTARCYTGDVKPEPLP